MGGEERRRKRSVGVKVILRKVERNIGEGGGAVAGGGLRFLTGPGMKVWYTLNL